MTEPYSSRNLRSRRSDIEKCELKKPKLETTPSERKQYAGGSSDFKDLVGTKYFVDKTLMINTLLNLEFRFILVSAPRRFGKTTNLSMVRYFFESREDERDKPLEDRQCSKIFDGLKIFDAVFEKLRQDFMGKYPIVLINFRCDTSIANKTEAVQECRKAIHEAFKQHAYLMNSDTLNTSQKEICRRWIDDVEYRTLADGEIGEGAKLLTSYLHYHFNENCLVLVDEYDSICAHAVFTIPSEDLRMVISFCMGILMAVVKDNEHVERAFLTGISQICSL